MDKELNGVFYLRKAEREDCDLLYKWVNEAEVRKSAFNTEEIKYDNHQKWFESILQQKDVYQYILMQNEKPIGQVRLNVKNEQAEIDYSIDKDCRGNGCGSLIIDLLKKQVKVDNIKIIKLIAQVKCQNNKSASCFINNGFDPIYTQYEYRIK